MSKRCRIAGVVLAAVGLILAGTLSVAAQGPLGRGPDSSTGFPNRAPALGHLGGRLGGMSANSEAIATALGLTVEELQAQLRDGATLADLADAQGIELDSLRDIAQEGRQTTILDRLSQALEEGAVTDAFAKWFRRGADAGFVLGKEAAPAADSPTIAAAAAALGTEPADVELQMWAGRTLADLAERAGVDLADVEAAIEAAQKSAAIEHIQRAVEEGSLTQERAEWMIEGVEGGFRAMGRFGGQLFEHSATPNWSGHLRLRR
jgi:hypothetical protein